MAQTAIKDFTSLRLDADIKGILLDFDNCLYIYEPCHKAALARIKTEFEGMIGQVEDFFSLYKEAQSVVKSRIHGQAASHSRVLYFQSMFELLGKGSMIGQSLLLENIYWDVFMKSMTLVKGAREFLEDCNKKGVQVIIVSDLTTSIQFAKLMKLGLSSLVNLVVTSEEAGAEKPDRRIFDLALKKSGLTYDQVIMIGDSMEKDVSGAKALGIKALHIIHE